MVWRFPASVAGTLHSYPASKLSTATRSRGFSTSIADSAATLARLSFSSPWAWDDMLPDLSMTKVTAREGMRTSVSTSMVTGSRRSTGVS